METLYDVHGIGAGALDGLLEAGRRIARAVERLHRQPPKPMPEIPVPEFPDMPQVRLEEVPAAVTGRSAERRGYGLSLYVHRMSTDSVTANAELNTPRARGSVKREILETLEPGEILDLTERAERLAAQLEAQADRRDLEIEQAIQVALRDADPVIRALAERITAERRAEEEREAWIREHGSERLRRLLAEDIEHTAVYRDERLAAERPDWRYDGRGLPGTASDPRNPPMDALELLDEARKTAPDARLAYWIAPQPCDCDDADVYGCQLEDGHEVRGYTCVATFLGRDIVFRVEDDGTPPIVVGEGED